MGGGCLVKGIPLCCLPHSEVKYSTKQASCVITTSRQRSALMLLQTNKRLNTHTINVNELH